MDRGDVYVVDLDPVSGREQAGRRFVLVVSPARFNALGTPWVCPITQGGGFARNAGFAVALSGLGTRTQGVVLCHQIRAMDLKARGAKLVERLPPVAVDEVLARIAPILE
jgi:mRNA interferase ChpB